MRKAYIVGIILLIALSQAASKLSPQEKLDRLREEMKTKGYKAVIIPSEDEHQSEYVAKYDLRREWLTEFTGSAGTAVVTETKAALWTDSRYYTQAEKQLDSNIWILMKSGESTTPRLNDWIVEQLNASEKVGQTAKFVSINTWNGRVSDFKKKDIILENTEPDLIDLIWPSDEREPKPRSTIKIHDIKYAGKTWQQKVEDVQKRLTAESADLFVVTALDEVAWLFNLRAADIPYNPMMMAYAIINREGNTHSFYIDLSRVDQKLRDHMNGVEFKEYSSIGSDIKQNSESNKKIWISPMSSYYIYSSVTNTNNMIMKASPIRSIKARKTDIEMTNMRNCHLRDSVARIRHWYWLDDEIRKNQRVTEKSSARKLESIQAEDNLFAMPSFEPISAVGANAAIVHYSTDEGDDLPLEKNKIYLLDAGAQYEDCTTDVTRTHHFGTPTYKERFAYTRVLQGSIDLANVVFPPGVYGRELDVEARQSLWRTGLDYGHGTGHGIGYYLGVHEAPPSTSYGGGGAYDETFEKGMVQSDEPGYYEENNFGIRLETDIETVEANTPYSFRDRKYLKFEPLTWVPFDRNLIDECALTNDQVDWLNKYYQEIRDKVSSKLSTNELRDFLMQKTKYFDYSYKLPYCDRYFPESGNNAQHISFSKSAFSILFILFWSIYRLL